MDLGGADWRQYERLYNVVMKWVDDNEIWISYAKKYYNLILIGMSYGEARIQPIIANHNCNL